MLVATPMAVALPFDLTDLDNFANGFPHELFAVHRREAPVYWHQPTRHTPDGEGFWSIATYAETLSVIRDSETYSSERGGTRVGGGTMLQDSPLAGVMLSMMDDPRHARIRRLVSTGLTPRMVVHLEEELRRRTRLLLDRIVDGVAFDFMREIAAELPLQAICILLGVPEEDRHWLCDSIEPIFDIRDGREVFETTSRSAGAYASLFVYARELIEAKRRHPTDDMLSLVVQAKLPDEEPPTLSDAELNAFFNLLFTAGSTTTHNAIAGGLLALSQHPAQLAALRRDPYLLAPGIEEMLRWTTPSSSKRRTATRRTEINGNSIQPGDKVLYWEASANRDELVFEHPMAFDIRREPNPHLTFGHGAHFCLGANLARLEMRVMFEELFAAFADCECAGPVEWARSNRHSGIRTLPMRLRRQLTA